MTIKFTPSGGTSLLMGDGTNFKIYRGGLTGLDSAPERTTAKNFSGVDGGHIASQFYSLRPISISGAILSPSVSQHYTDRQSLINVLPINKDVDVEFLMPNGQTYYAKVRRTGLSLEHVSVTYSRYKIDILSEDPLLYDISSGSALSVTVPKKVGGGAVLPWILPIIFGAGSGPTAINNNGNAKVYPKITITGSAVNPKVTNLTTGEFVKINVTMGSGDTLVIDLKERTVSLNGANILAYRDSSSKWWGLEIGNNNIEFTTDSGADTGQAVVTWRPAYTGI